MASRWWNPGHTLGRQFILLIGAAIVATQVTDLCVRLAMPPTISGVSMGLVLTRIQTARPALDAASATAAQDVARSIGDRRFRVTLTPTPPPPVAPPSAPRARQIAILALGLPESAVRIVKFGPEHELHMPPPRNATPAGLGIRPNVPPNVEIDPARFDYVVLPGRPLALAIRTGHGWLVVQDAENGEAVWLAGIVPDLAITVLLLLPLGLWAGSRVGHKLRTFSAAIAEAGAAPNAPPLEEDGPTELRQVIRAVNQMRARILSLQADRDMMMAAMSHDVRTPLARLRFRIADLPPDVRRPIGEEIARRMAAADKGSPLSHREVEVLVHLRDGLSYQDIGRRMAIAERTARAHVAAIKEKLAAATAAQCVSRGYELGILRRSQESASVTRTPGA